MLHPIPVRLQGFLPHTTNQNLPKTITPEFVKKILKSSAVLPSADLPSRSTSPGSSDSSEKVSTPPKKVCFDPIVKVILIPTSKELHNAGLAPNLWYTKKEEDTSKKNCSEEIVAIQRQYPLLSQKQATDLWLNSNPEL